MSQSHEMPKVIVVREMAKDLKVKNYSRMRKNDLIRAVQLAEGNQACYQQIPDCAQKDCLWRRDCLA